MSKKNLITKSDGLSALKLVLHAMIREGMSIEEIVEETNSILQGLIDSNDISLLSTSNLGTVKQEHISKLGDLVFDSLRRIVFYKGQKVNLSPNETKLMGHFLSNPGILIRHETIVKLLYADNKIDSNPAKLCRPLISRLRKRLSQLPDGEIRIDTVRGEGYVFNEEFLSQSERNFLVNIEI